MIIQSLTGIVEECKTTKWGPTDRKLITRLRILPQDKQETIAVTLDGSHRINKGERINLRYFVNDMNQIAVEEYDILNEKGEVSYSSVNDR